VDVNLDHVVPYFPRLYRCRIPEDNESHIPDFVIEVVRLISSPIQFRTVLIVEVKNSQHWEAGIPSLERQIKRQTDTAFSGTAVSQVYWIGVIGPRWRYGVKEDDRQDPRPLINWHDITHDQASYTDLQALVALIAAGHVKVWFFFLSSANDNDDYFGGLSAISCVPGKFHVHHLCTIDLRDGSKGAAAFAKKNGSLKLRILQGETRV
jgi:hypothetical protein